MLPVLFVAYYSIVTFFMHTHSEYGATIVHSHPFRQSESNSTLHEHPSKAEALFFYQLSDITIQDGAVKLLVITGYTDPVAVLKEKEVTLDLPVIFPGDLSLRAPPAAV